MNYQIKVNGMHCESCKTLVGMALEEAELPVVSVELSEEGEGGTVKLEEATIEQLELAKELINGAGHYEVAEVTS